MIAVGHVSDAVCFLQAYLTTLRSLTVLIISVDVTLDVPELEIIEPNLSEGALENPFSRRVFRTLPPTSARASGRSGVTRTTSW